MLISHRHKFIFLKTRKTAGTSVEVSLSRYLGSEDVITPISPADEALRADAGVEPRNWQGLFNPLPSLILAPPREKVHALRDFLHRRRFRNHHPASRVRLRVDPGVWQSYFKFCFERNPWDKCVSHYFWRRRRKKPERSFEEYVRAGDLPTDRHRYLRRRRLQVDFVGRFENLSHDLAEACRIVGIPFDGWLPRAKGGVRDPASRPYQRFVGDRDRRSIAAAFAPELRLFGYRFERPGRAPLLLREDLERATVG